MPARKVFNVAIIDRFPFSNWYSLDLARELSKLLFKNSIYLYGPKNNPPKETPFYVYRSLWSPHLWPFQVLNQSIRDNIEIIHLQFELVTFGHIYTSLLLIPFFLLSKLIGIKIIITLHGPIFPNKNALDTIDSILPSYSKFIKFLFKYYCISLYKMMSKCSSAIIVHGHTFKVFLHQYEIYNSYSIPHGIGKIINLNIESKFPIKINQESKIILFFGILSPRKGLEYLIKAFSKLLDDQKKVVLLISGRESKQYRGYTKKIKKLAHDLNIEHEVLFSGHLEEHFIEELYQKAELVVFPYISSSSASGPLSIAMAYGKPIIATSTPYISELLINNCNALLVPPKNVELLSKSMNVLLTNEYLRNKLSANIIRKAETNSWRIIAYRTKELYNKVFNNNSW